MSNIRHGGLMRCCVQSVDENDKTRTVEPKEGDLLRCTYCREGHEPPNMVFRDGAWEWRGPEAYNTDLQLQPAT